METALCFRFLLLITASKDIPFLQGLPSLESFGLCQKWKQPEKKIGSKKKNPRAKQIE